MAKLSKRAKAIKAKVDRTKPYPFENAIALVKELATAKFNESIDVAIQLGVDAKKSDQVVRGSVVLSPYSPLEPKLMRQKPPVPISLVWKTSLSASRVATCLSMS